MMNTPNAPSSWPPDPSYQPDLAQLKSFLDTIMSPDGNTSAAGVNGVNGSGAPRVPVACTEIRLFGADWARAGWIVPAERYSKTLAGWYDDPELLVNDVRGIRGVSVYLVSNPVDSVYLSRASNKLIVAKKDMATHDDDIRCLRWMFIDIDPPRPRGKGDLSATQEERAAALDVRDAILAAHPEIQAASLWGTSGNGGTIFVRLPDLPNTADNRTLVGKALRSLAERFDAGNGASVDPKCKNPSRLMALPGTFKCKGSDRPERPWRRAEIHGRSPTLAALPLSDWVASYLPEKPEKGEGETAGRSTARPPKRRAVSAGRPDPIERARKYLMSMAPAVSKQGGHDQTFDAACALIHGFDLSPEQARPLLWEWNEDCVPPWSPAELEHKLESADARKSDRPRGYLLDDDGAAKRNGRSRPAVNGHAGEGPGDGGDSGDAGTGRRPMPPGLPEIECRDVSLDIVTMKALDAMARSNDPPRVFEFGGQLARIRQRADEGGRPVIEVMGVDALRNYLGAWATFTETTLGRRGEIVTEVFPPVSIVRAVASQENWHSKVAPPLEMVAESPRFLADGKLLCTPGYCRPAHLYYHPSGNVGDPAELPERPMAAQVTAALSLIFDQYLVDFPFADQASRANALAVMLLPFVRLLIDGPTPLHLFEASTEGTGKGKLANACSFPALGYALPSTPQKEGEAEWRKWLTAALMKGNSHIFIDNLYNPRSWDGTSEPIDSGTLASALTQPMWEDRLLNQSKEVSIRIKCIWMASGNNVAWSREFARRIVPIRLIPASENPSQREGFACEPLTLEEWAEAHRPELLMACLTICQNWLAQGHPPGPQRMGSYESYAKVMGGILAAAGVDGFLANWVEPTTQDRESLRWVALVRAWSRAYASKPVSASEVHALIFGDYSSSPAVPSCPELQVAFIDVVGEKSPLSQKQKLGHALGKQVDRVWAGHRIMFSQARSRAGNQLYRLEALDDSETEPATQEEEGAEYVPF